MFFFDLLIGQPNTDSLLAISTEDNALLHGYKLRVSHYLAQNQNLLCLNSKKLHKGQFFNTSALHVESMFSYRKVGG